MFTHGNLFRQVWLGGTYCCQIIIHDPLIHLRRADSTLSIGSNSLCVCVCVCVCVCERLNTKPQPSLNCRCGSLRCRLRISWQAYGEEVTSPLNVQWTGQEHKKSGKDFLAYEFHELSWIRVPHVKANLSNIRTLILNFLTIVPKPEAIVDRSRCSKHWVPDISDTPDLEHETHNDFLWKLKLSHQIHVCHHPHCCLVSLLCCLLISTRSSHHGLHFLFFYTRDCQVLGMMTAVQRLSSILQPLQF
jgi:hypothetical protein